VEFQKSGAELLAMVLLSSFVVSFLILLALRQVNRLPKTTDVTVLIKSGIYFGECAALGSADVIFDFCLSNDLADERIFVNRSSSFFTLMGEDVAIINCEMSGCGPHLAGRRIAVQNIAIVNALCDVGSALLIDVASFTNVTVADCSFARNKAHTGQGGAVLIRSAEKNTTLTQTDIKIIDNYFDLNTATADGGSLSIQFDVPIVNSQIIIERNTMDSSISVMGAGGALDVFFNSTVANSTVLIQYLSISGAFSQLGAGGIRVLSRSASDRLFVGLSHVVVSNSRADSFAGGGARMEFEDSSGLTVQLLNVTMRGSTALASSGGGLFLASTTTSVNCSFRITDLNVYDSSSPGWHGGGAVVRFEGRATNARLQMSGGVFRNNTCGKTGGGLRVVVENGDQTWIYIDGTVFEDNQGESGGGLALYLRGSNTAKVLLSTLQFYRCTALMYGGGMDFSNIDASFSSHVSVSMSMLTFDNCSSFQGGGASFASGVYDLIEASSLDFRGCSSNYSGAGILFELQKFQLRLSNSSFVDCASLKDGGGIAIVLVGSDLQDTTVQISSSVFRNNSVSNRGGGISVFSDMNNNLHLNVSDCAFFNCTAGLYGGGISLNSYNVVEGSAFVAMRSTFDQCDAKLKGSAISVSHAIVLSALATVEDNKIMHSIGVFQGRIISIRSSEVSSNWNVSVSRNTLTDWTPLSSSAPLEVLCSVTGDDENFLRATMNYISDFNFSFIASSGFRIVCEGDEFFGSSGQCSSGLLRCSLFFRVSSF
jgi:hypothetical protein